MSFRKFSISVLFSKYQQRPSRQLIPQNCHYWHCLIVKNSWIQNSRSWYGSQLGQLVCC